MPGDAFSRGPDRFVHGLDEANKCHLAWMRRVPRCAPRRETDSLAIPATLGYGTVNSFSIPMTTGTLFYQEFEALDLVDASEARFLSSAVRDAVRQAQRHGQYEAKFHLYLVRAWREPLGSRLVTVSWRVSRGDEPVAGDTHILQAP